MSIKQADGMSGLSVVSCEWAGWIEWLSGLSSMSLHVSYVWALSQALLKGGQGPLRAEHGVPLRVEL